MKNDYRILIIDDDLKPLKGHIRLLEANGYQVAAAETGETGLELTYQTQPHLTILDLVMPGMDGYEVCRRLKSKTDFKAPYIVMLSAQMTDSDHIVNGLGLGADDYLFKPITKEVLLARVNAIFRLIDAEREIRRQKKRAERYLNLAGVMFIGLDLDGVVNLVNRKACQVLECDRSEIMGRDWVDHFIPLNTQDTMRAVFKRLLQGGIDAVEYYENPVLTKSGEEKIISWHNAYIKNDEGEIVGILASGEDLTEKRMLESQLQDAQKMESIGNLAGGIAHDFNNLLFPIVGMSEMLLEDLPPESPEHENVREIFKAGLRGSELVKQILAFSRQAEHTKTPVRMQQLVKEVVKLCRSTIPSDIIITSEIQLDCGLVNADATQLQQVVMNLVTNAYHALESTGGEITIKLQEIVLNVDDVIGMSLDPGRYAMLRVSDNGGGIDPDIIKMIFEPYFTTKEVGKGTGLGLAVVYGIIREHGGEIQVKSEPNQGAEFTVYIPLMTRPVRGAELERQGDLPRGDERILVVDDEPSIAKLEKQMLERLGYRVRMRTCSLEALEAFRNDPHAVDMILTDMSMPDLTGAQLAEKIMSIKPDLPVILCTGFSERIDENKARSMGIKGFLLKPIVKFDMAQMVRRLLDQGKTK